MGGGSIGFGEWVGEVKALVSGWGSIGFGEWVGKYRLW